MGKISRIVFSLLILSTFTGCNNVSTINYGGYTISDKAFNCYRDDCSKIPCRLTYDCVEKDSKFLIYKTQNDNTEYDGQTILYTIDNISQDGIREIYRLSEKQDWKNLCNECDKLCQNNPSTDIKSRNKKDTKDWKKEFKDLAKGEIHE